VIINKYVFRAGYSLSPLSEQNQQKQF